MLKEDITQRVIDRFDEKFTKRRKNQCWEWTANRHKQGYGFFRLGKRMELAHRVSYLIHKGIVSKFVLHECDNPCCVNPHHLSLGTQAKNMKDAARRNRMGYNLTIVRRIRKLLKLNWKELDICRDTGVSRAAVWRIRYNHSHKESK